MANLKFIVLVVVAAIVFGLPSGMYALICKCSLLGDDCIRHEQTCKKGSTECVRVTTQYKPRVGGGIFINYHCNYVPPNNFELPPEGNGGTCRHLFERHRTIDYCFCKTDLCDPPDPDLLRPSTGNKITSRSWSWILLSISIFASSAVIVPAFAFVGGQ